MMEKMCKKGLGVKQAFKSYCNIVVETNNEVGVEEMAGLRMLTQPIFDTIDIEYS